MLCLLPPFPAPPESQTNSDMSSQMNESDVVELTGKIMLVAVIILFTVLILVSFLHLYAKWFWSRADHNSRRPSGVSADRQHQRAVHNGLDSSVLKSIPVVIFSEKDTIECAVCLSQVTEGEKGRLLPKCKHGFHVECIDMWFQSHSTCPICRNPLSNLVPLSSLPVEETRIEIAAPPEVEMEVPVTGTVSFSGATELPSTSASTREMVTEIPKQMNYKQQEQESKSPSTATPTPTPTPRRMASFKRLFISSSRDTELPSTSESTGEMVIEIPKQMYKHQEDSKSPSTPTPTRMSSFKRLFVSSSRDTRIDPTSSVEQGFQ